MIAELMHYGIKRKSGRYPWGSGEDEFTRSQAFYKMIDDLKSAGMKDDKDIAKAIGVAIADLNPGDDGKFSVADLRDTRTIAKERIVHEQTQRAIALKDKGTSIQVIAEDLGLPVATVRSRLSRSESYKQSSLMATADMLRKNVDEHTIVDIGKGVNLNLSTGVNSRGVSPEKLRAASSVLRDEGYETYNLQVKQPGTNQFTNQKVMVPPGTGFGNAKRMVDQIHTIGEFTENDGLTYFGIHTPMNISSRRLQVKFAEDGGTAEDGAIYIRPGAKDLDMGKNTYAQVRIAVDGTHFIKGLAVIKHDLPPGVDIQFNTNKSKSVGKIGALKELTGDPKNPFGSVIKRQIVDIDKAGNQKVKSAVNIVNEEGDWDAWRNSLPSQMLAKQPHSLIKSQLTVTREQTLQRLSEIAAITNPVVRQNRLDAYADQIDADAVDLRAAAMPHQRTAVIVPMVKMNKNEIYAPGFETGERVVLIRYPHGGRFEIPEVTVNNNNRTAKKMLGNATDAIGIHPSVAERLSGADFDGDTVVVIPNRDGHIKGVSSLRNSGEANVYEKAFADFEPKRKYGGFVQTGEDAKGRPIGNFKLMTNTGLEMGKITNLVTDMSIQGAKAEHVVRAVRHSMVVIDAEKHKLDYKKSELDNGISQLKALYQGDSRAGATTLLSKATAKVTIPERKERSAKAGGSIDPKTGVKVYEDTGRSNNKYDPKTRTYLDEKVPVNMKVKKLALHDNAFDLVRDPNDPVEKMYADHANDMKAMANKARLEAHKIVLPKSTRQAKEAYANEVADLKSQLTAALKQKPLERRVNVLANAVIKQARMEDPSLREDRDRMQKIEKQARDGAQARLGITRSRIDISDRAWDAIQAGAVSSSMLKEILNYTDSKRIEELARPRTNSVMTTALTSRAKAMFKAGATTADVARALGIPASTLREASKRGDLT